MTHQHDIPPERAETVFSDFKPAFTADHAVVEANRCLYCLDAPCITACPTGINIPEFIRKIATRNVEGAAKTIFDSNILGMSCARVCPVEVLCVGECVYNRLEQPPIQIGKLQRYATDAAFAAGWEFYRAGPDSGKRVALIGGGPASLACAHGLRRYGHRVTIYEKRSVLGGLNTTGVAPYKMKADRAAEEVRWVLGIGGIDVKCGLEVGRDVTLAELEEEYDAIFVGIGLGPDSALGIPGEALPGIEGAVQAIERFKLGAFDRYGIRTAVVVGGGNTAIDAVRELVGLGVPHVTLLYRGKESGMPGYAHEWKAAKLDGAHTAWQTQPIAFVGEEYVRGIRCMKVDEQKKPIAGSEHEIAADLVLVAIGQAKLVGALAALGGIVVDKQRLHVDAKGATGRPKWFAGGDLTNGGKEVVNAVAEGRDAAHGIHAFLTGAKA